MACPCCTTDRCCCKSDGTISQITVGDECSGATLPRPDTGTCAGKPLTVSWCGLSVTLNSPDTSAFATASYEVSDDCNTGNPPPCSNCVFGATLSVYKDNALGWGVVCNRCTVTLYIALQEATVPCGTATRTYKVTWREGCDAEPILTFVGGDAAFFKCGSLAPTATIGAP